MSDDAAIALGPLLAADFSTAPELWWWWSVGQGGSRVGPFKHAVPPTSAGSSSRRQKPMKRIRHHRL